MTEAKISIGIFKKKTFEKKKKTSRRESKDTLLQWFVKHLGRTIIERHAFDEEMQPEEPCVGWNLKRAKEYHMPGTIHDKTPCETVKIIPKLRI